MAVVAGTAAEAAVDFVAAADSAVAVDIAAAADTAVEGFAVPRWAGMAAGIVVAIRHRRSTEHRRSACRQRLHMQYGNSGSFNNINRGNAFNNVSRPNVNAGNAFNNVNRGNAFNNINRTNNFNNVNVNRMGTGWNNPYMGYHNGWVHGYWNGHYPGGWGWRPYGYGGYGYGGYGGFGYGFGSGLGWGLGMGLGYGLSSWMYGPMLNNWGYSSYYNPYYGAGYGGAGIAAQPIVYDYSQPIDSQERPQKRRSPPRQRRPSTPCARHSKQGIMAGHSSSPTNLSRQCPMMRLCTNFAL